MYVWECVFGLVQGACSFVIAARRCMHVWDRVFGLVKAHGDCDCCEAMHACMEVCVSACLGLCKAHGHCDRCEVMHGCV